MTLDFVRVGVLVVTLAAACAADLRRCKIPNTVTVPALLLGLMLAGGQGGTPALGQALAGAGVASPALLLYAGRMLGAGDVKLLWAVGVLTGPHFMLWALPCTALAGGVLALLWAARRGTRRLPYAPAIVLGVLAAAWLCPAGLTRLTQSCPGDVKSPAGKSVRASHKEETCFPSPVRSTYAHFCRGFHTPEAKLSSDMGLTT